MASTSSQPPPVKRRRTDGGPCGLEKKHKVFLSHSGADKAFVSHLCQRLNSVHHYPFFDVREDSLPLGDKFADIIFEACKQCQLAIVVVSEDYFKSKWPMLELAWFVEAQNDVNPEMKILPLFYKLTVDEFKEPERQRAWFKKWESLKECDNRLDILRWKDAVRVLGGHNGAVYCRTGETEDAYIERIVQSVFRSVPPDMLYDDSHVKGGTYLYQAIDKMFEESLESRLAGRVECSVIGIYGLGGSGKTNLCQIAYNKFVGEFFGRACVIEIGSKSKSALESQREALSALTGAHDVVLKSLTDVDKGRRLYKERVGSHKVFAAIDNALDDSKSFEEALAYLVPELHPASKVLVTARCKETLTNLGIKGECCLEMPDLSEEHAMGIFLHHACASSAPIELANPEHLEVVKKCIFCARYRKTGWYPAYHFHPLSLKVLGLLMKTLTPFPSKWIEILNNRKILGSKMEDVYSVLRTSFDMLPDDDHRAMFLDVAIYAPKRLLYKVCKWLSIVYDQEYDVVKDKLEVLGARGLLDHCHHWRTEKISMHDLYMEFAEAKVTRENTQKGQTLFYQKGEDNIPKWLMRNPKGAESFSFERMRFSNVHIDSFQQAKLDKCTDVEVLKLDRCYGLKSLDLGGFENLCSLEVLECPDLEHVEGLKNLDKLVWMSCNSCFRDFKGLTSLRELRMSSCVSSILTWPILDLRDCHNLERVGIWCPPELEDFPRIANTFRGSWDVRHPRQEHLDVEAWTNAEFLDWASCASLTNELERCPIMRDLKHLDVSHCSNYSTVHRMEILERYLTLVDRHVLTKSGCSVNAGVEPCDWAS